MKKILGLLPIMCMSMILTAQIKKGAVLLGGQLSYNRNVTINYGITPPEQVNKSGNFGISAGKAFRENAVFGLNVSYSSSNDHNYYSNSNGTMTSNRKIKQYSAGIFYRKYKQLIKDLYFFAEGGASYIGLGQKEDYPPANTQIKYTQSGGRVYITPGISYNIFKNFQAELLIPSIFSAGFTHSNSDQNDFSVYSGLQNTNLGYLGVGFHFIL